MGKEIEHKYLVKSDEYRKVAHPVYYKQGYLSSSRQCVVRVRIAGDKGWITIKGALSGITRSEYEYEIPVAEANEMLDNLCQKPLIEKYRYRVPYEGYLWEVDEFLGENYGLIFAEIELPTEETQYRIPDWIGENVTGDFRYYNSNLVTNPYSNWKDNK